MFKSNLDGSYMGVYNSGIFTLDEEIEGMSNVKLVSYDFMDVNIFQLTDDVVIITYTTNADRSYKDKLLFREEIYTFNLDVKKWSVTWCFAC